MKNVKLFFKDYHSDMCPDLDVEDIKKKIIFKQSSSKFKYRGFNYRTAFAMILAFLIVVPATIIITLSVSKSHSTNPEKGLDYYLESNFEKHIKPSIHSEVLSDNYIISFYYAKNNDLGYLVVNSDSEENYGIDFSVDGKSLMRIDQNTNSIMYFLIESNDFVLSISLFHEDQEISTKDISFDLAGYDKYLS